MRPPDRHSSAVGKPKGRRKEEGETVPIAEVWGWQHAPQGAFRWLQPPAAGGPQSRPRPARGRGSPGVCVCRWMMLNLACGDLRIRGASPSFLSTAPEE